MAESTKPIAPTASKRSRAPLFLAAGAIGAALPYLICQLCGWQEYVSVLSGSIGAPAAVFRGLLVVLSYILLTFATPILGIAAAIAGITTHIWPPCTSSPHPPV